MEQIAANSAVICTQSLTTVLSYQWWRKAAYMYSCI